MARGPFHAATLVALAIVGSAAAGDVWRITSVNGKAQVTYEVKFGGGRLFEQATAYDPASKKFVYLQWPRDGAKPAPAGSIWDHKTGATIVLYKFPDVAQPLPIIPSIKDLTICPLTGSKNLAKERTIIFD